LSPTEKYVMIALADYGQRIHPSLAHLSAKTGLHPNTLSRAIVSLRAKGFLSTRGTGKALNYVLHPHHNGDATVTFKGMHRHHNGDAPSPLKGRDPNYQRTTKEPRTADAVSGVVASSWDGIDPDDCRRIRNWHPRGDADALCAAQRRVTFRKLAELGVRVTDHARWWHQLGKEWARIGVPPYDQLATALESLGEVRDRVSVLAFRIGLGKVAA
jgi:hypothetical protein